MNKLVLGGILVTVMGGVPGATYLLTGGSEDQNATTKSEKDVSDAGDSPQEEVSVNNSAQPSKGSSSCKPETNENTCSEGGTL